MGPKLAKLFEQKEVRTIRDACFFLPRDYQDRTKITKINECVPDSSVLIHAQVISYSYIPIRTRNKPIFEVTVTDSSGEKLSLKWFAYHKESFELKFLEAKDQLKPTLLVYGKVTQYAPGRRMEIIHPEIEWDIDEEELKSGIGMVPIYSETEGLHQKLIRKVVAQSMLLAQDHLHDEIPENIMKELQLPDIRDALTDLHHPPKGANAEELKGFRTKNHDRLIFEELFKFEWIVGRRRLNVRQHQTESFSAAEGIKLLSHLKKNIPYELTGDQTIAIEKIYEDLATNKPMNRLIQGDVGCGKTLVSFASTLPIIAAKAQCTMMVPTEILAEQHFLNAKNFLKGIARVELLVGSTKKSERTRILSELEKGEVDLLIGTHALIEDPVIFKKLALIIIDEQHRFGVDQRMRLRLKGNHPHLLSMTATPIPRTLALTYYGDLDVTTIKQLPKGRPEIHTKLFRNKDRDRALSSIKEELKKGHQAYVLFPLVEESEKIDLANAVQGAEELANGPMKGFHVGLLHGRMKGEEKTDIMDRFKKGEIQVLVSTTVIEVGVDVPNATVIMIENAERFGLSQLHQLRGRVGRGKETSYCYLMSNAGSEDAFQRLHAMEKTRDGFQLSELDLEIRGPGEFLGTRQSGELQFKFSDLNRDQDLLTIARKYAFDLLKQDPDLVKKEHIRLKNYFIQSGSLSEQRLSTG